MLCPIIWAMVPARRCGSYALMSTLMPTDLAVQTVSGTAIPDFPPWNDVSPLQDKETLSSDGRQGSDQINNPWFCISQHKPSTCQSQDSLFGIVTRLWAGWSGIWFPVEERDFFICKMSKVALEPIQLPIQWATGALSAGLQQLGCMKYTTHFWLVLSLRMNGTVILLLFYAFML